ncbi:hypothetical protein M6D81_11405 [Paenibacillus sp. J5C_2022]|uniref:hypothetical protein n=1 Tax=Paenibacillus sp. J5C2022 TaxID=2977129 RepID=UPI0021CE79E1|nr:hypothetical protein [Paenibacillus sp. J5C2022]MCU6709313.1 hypothetical protein [Paenibacillus sp. J5C2022]
MKITETHDIGDFDAYEYCGKGSLTVTVEDDAGNSKVVDIMAGEPEDAVFYRDLNGAYSIAAAIKLAYEAGKRGGRVMNSVIEMLRKHVGKQGEVWDEAYEEIDVAFDGYLSGEDGVSPYTAEKVDEEFEDGGRWSNYRTTVHKIEEESGTVAYFSLWRELPATEIQDGGDFSYELDEVVPREVTVTRYVAKPKGAV